MGQDKGFFLVIEGLDGSGKTHLSRALKRVLQNTHSDNVELTFEPHDPSSAGLYIRQVLTKRIKNVKSRTLALAYALNRADHNDRVIQPFLENTTQTSQNRIMICDRYYLSSLVYQSSADVSFDEIMLLNKGVRKPDITLFLNVSEKTAYARMRKRPENKELFEKNLETTRKKYHKAIEFLRSKNERVVEIDADGTVEEVLNSALEELRVHGPDWLKIQLPLLDAPYDVFLLDDLDNAEAKISEIVERFHDKWTAGELGGGNNLQQLKVAIETEVDRMGYDDLGLTFVGALKRLGYKVVDRLPWTEICAYELAYEMPFKLGQRGTALLLTETQRYDVATKKIQLILDQTADYADINRLSNFMFVLDATPSLHLERDYDPDAGTGKLSPTVLIMHRRDIADLLLVEILMNLYNELMNVPHLSEMISEIVSKYNLEKYWESTPIPLK